MNKIYLKSLLVALLMGISFASRSQIINTIAGNGYSSYSGDGGLATAAELYGPGSTSLDIYGNIYISDAYNQRIRIINTSGIISTFAGNGFGSYSGDGGPATAAELYQPFGVAVDASGNIYIADFDNNRIRKVNTSGIINTIAGNGVPNYSGDGGQATLAEISFPPGVAVDVSGNIYIADFGNNRIRKVNTSGIISTLAGNGMGSFSGDGGPATVAEIFMPYCVTSDASGNVYIGDTYNSRVRIVNTSGIISTFAGNGTGSYAGDGGPATAAELYYPYQVSLDLSGNIYIADGGNNRIRKVNSSGIISTFAGNGANSFSGDGGQATAAELSSPTGVTLDASGNLYITDYDNSRIRKITGITTAISETPPAPYEVNFYPVPTTGFFTITGIAQGQVIELYNYLGQKVQSAISPIRTVQPGGHQQSANFDISSMPNGIYLIRILSKDGSVFATKKIVKTE